MPKFFTIYDKPDSVGLSMLNKESMTLQSCAPQCDINNILKRFKATGIMPHVSKVKPEYVDAISFSEKASNAFALTQQANSLFDSLPSDLRQTVFGGEISNFIEAIGKDVELQKQLGFDVPAEKPVSSTVVTDPVVQPDVTTTPATA